MSFNICCSSLDVYPYPKIELITRTGYLQTLYLNETILSLHINPDVETLSKVNPPESFKGKYLGVLVLTIVQFLNGTIHAIIGAGFAIFGIGAIAYNIYTFLYGVFNLIFLYGLWTGKKTGWTGTILVSIFVIIIDICTTLDIQIIPGVPKSAALGEIVISLAILVYLLQPKIRQLFTQTN